MAFTNGTEKMPARRTAGNQEVQKPRSSKRETEAGVGSVARRARPFGVQLKLTARAQESVFEGLEAENERGGRSLGSQRMHSHGEGQLRRCGGAGQKPAGRTQTKSGEPFFGRLMG